MTAGIDVDAVAGRGDRDFPALYQLFGGYFHQDWKLEYADWPEAVTAFAEEAPPHLREDALTEIARILAAGLSEDEIARLLYPILDCNFLPGARDIASADWLKQIADQLQAATAG